MSPEITSSVPNDEPTVAATPAPKEAQRKLSREFKDFSAQIPDKLLFGLMLFGWLMLFQFYGNSTLGYIRTRSLFAWLNYDYQMMADDQHGYLIPFAVLVLLWHKRKELIAVSKKSSWSAIGIVAFALLLHIVGFLIQQIRLSIVAFFIGLYGLMGLTWGWSWLRVTFFPFFLFGFCVPIGNYIDFVTFRLRLVVTTITVAVCHTLFGMEIVQNGTGITNSSGTYQYDVAAACSGIRSLTAMFAITVIFAFVSFRKNWQRCILILSAFPMAVISNLLRLMMIILAAEIFGQSAGNYVHESGWLSLLPYLPALIGIYLIAHVLREKPGCES